MSEIDGGSPGSGNDDVDPRLADGAPEEGGRSVEGPPPPPQERPGLPWEQAGGRAIGSATDTIRMVLFEPAAAFSRMRLEGPLGDPLLFAILFGTVGTFFGLVWQSAFRTALGRLGGADFTQIALFNSFGVFVLLLAPVFVLLWVAITTLLLHLGLLLFGGAPRPVDVTLRTVAYTSGATYLFAVLPICGGVLSFLWWLVVTAIGLREAQGVPGGRAVLAILAPVGLLCLCCGLIWVVVFSAAVSLPAL